MELDQIKTLNSGCTAFLTLFKPKRGFQNQFNSSDATRDIREKIVDTFDNYLEALTAGKTE